MGSSYFILFIFSYSETRQDKTIYSIKSIIYWIIFYHYIMGFLHNIYNYIPIRNELEKVEIGWENITILSIIFMKCSCLLYHKTIVIFNPVLIISHKYFYQS